MMKTRTAVCLLVMLAALSLSAGIRITEPTDGATVPTLSDGQKAYLAMPRAERVAYFADYAKRDEMCKLTGCPRPVRIAWQDGTAPFDVTVRRMPDGRVFFRKRTADSSVGVDNLEIARRYEVTVEDVAGKAVATFETEDLAPRLIRVPGVPNVRDLGGWKTLDGRRVKQGMALRTSGMNENAEGLMPGRTKVTAETREVMLGFFGIRSDIDLRSDRECLLMQGSPLGPSVSWFHVSSSAYGDMTNASARAAFKTVFSVFLDRTSYPIAFHCIGGKDRTGSVAFILGALLGVAEEDLYRDWEATGFWLDERDFIHRTRFDKLIRVFDGFPGATLHERVKAYVKDLGFTDADIETLREILLEEPSGQLSGFKVEEDMLRRYADKLPPGRRVGFVEASVGESPEAFSVQEREGAVFVSGANRRARIFGLGRLLREPDFRGISSPDLPVRGIYFATHFGNWYDNASEREIREYVEDIALWGCNQVRVWFDMHDFRGMDDPDAAPRVARLKAILRAATDCGLETSLLGLANEAFADSPAALRADWHGGQNGYVRELAGHYHVELCPSKPGGLDQILAWRAQVLDAFADQPVSQFAIFPYDQGGCTCAGCAPWGANGLMKIVPAFSRLVREKMPGCRVELSTWYFDHFGDLGEWKAIFAQGAELAKYVDSLSVEQLGRIVYGTPGGLPASSMSEISMNGMLPWGCFGANPQPRRFEAEVKKGRGKLTGFRPYSEGIYEDMNKVILLQLAWDGKMTADDVVGAYAAFHFGEAAREAVSKAASMLEDNLGFDVRIVQGAKSYDAYGCGKADPAKPFTFRLSGKRPDLARAEAAERLLAEADAKLPADVRASWRWRILLLRTQIDRALAAGAGVDDKVVQTACGELCGIYRVNGTTEPFLTPPGPAFNPQSFSAGHL